MERHVGLRVFNDDATPAGFVVRLLQTELGLSGRIALAAMLRVHSTGQEVVALVPETDAGAVAARLSAAIEKRAVVLRFEMTAPLDPAEEAEWHQVSRTWPDPGSNNLGSTSLANLIGVGIAAVVVTAGFGALFGK